MLKPQHIQPFPTVNLQFFQNLTRNNYTYEHVFGFMFKPCGPMILPNQMEILPRIPQGSPITSFTKKRGEKERKITFLSNPLRCKLRATKSRCVAPGNTY